MEPSKLYRGRDASGIWHYGYFVEQWIYDIEKKYVQVDVATVGKAIDVEDKTGTPIYTGDTFEYKGYKFVVEYDKDGAGYVGKGIDNPTYQISGYDLKRMIITGNIHD